MLTLGPFEMSDICLRLGLAVLFGAIIGLNRNLNGKPAGLKTHSLVALGSALVVLIGLRMEHPLLATAQTPVELNAVSRVMQGILQGIGFIGAGIILHSESSMKVYGLTTAASIWFTALVGVGCGAGTWSMTTVAFVLAISILVVGDHIENFFGKLIGSTKDDE